MEDFEGDLSKNLDIVRDINLKLGNDNFKLNGIGEYIENLKTENKKIKKKYSTLKEKIKDILLNYQEIEEENPSSEYLTMSLENLITEFENCIKNLAEENEELNENCIENLDEENKELNDKIEKIKNEVIEILLICEETPKNDILDNLIFLKRKLHYNFSLFNILYIFCYTIFYFYIFYNFNYNNIYIYILFLLIIVYTFI